MKGRRGSRGGRRVGWRGRWSGGGGARYVICLFLLLVVVIFVVVVVVVLLRVMLLVLWGREVRRRRFVVFFEACWRRSSLFLLPSLPLRLFHEKCSVVLLEPCYFLCKFSLLSHNSQRETEKEKKEIQNRREEKRSDGGQAPFFS